MSKSFIGNDNSRKQKIALLRSIAAGHTPLNKLIAHDDFIIVTVANMNLNHIINLTRNTKQVVTDKELVEWERSEAEAANYIVKMPHNNRETLS